VGAGIAQQAADPIAELVDTNPLRVGHFQRARGFLVAEKVQDTALRRSGHHEPDHFRETDPWLSRARKSPTDLGKDPPKHSGLCHFRVPAP
jgi:hypothetical protein